MEQVLQNFINSLYFFIISVDVNFDHLVKMVTYLAHLIESKIFS